MLNKAQGYHQVLRCKIDQYVHLVYKVSKAFPKEELYGVTSQLRRSTLSVALNYIEGYARRRPGSASLVSFWDTSYASLQESKYLVEFSSKEEFLSSETFTEIISLANEIGAMLWTLIDYLKKHQKN